MSKAIVYQNPWFEVIKDGHWHYIHEPNAKNGAVVVARKAQQTLLVSIHRQAQDGELIELPRGYGEPGETSAACAARELAEETGYQLTPTDFELIGHVKPNTAILSSNIPVFRCELNAAMPRHESDNEVTSIVWTDDDDIPALIRAGKISCGITLAALMLHQNSN